jgi:hypothetical protein
MLPGERVPAIPGKQVLFRNGLLYSEQTQDTEPVPETVIPVTIHPAAAVNASLPMF